MSKLWQSLLFTILPSLAIAADYSNGQAARAVYGQIQFTGALTAPSEQVLGGASGLAYANGQLFVADSNRVGAVPQNNRVLIFPTGNLPDAKANLTPRNPFNNQCQLCGFPATVVVGQSGFNSNVPGRTNISYQNPVGVASDGKVMAVADTDNNRVLVYNTIPAANNAPADIVLGQPDFTTLQPSSGVSGQTLRGPEGVWIQGGKLYVADTQNSRVLVWNSIPTQNNQPADFVLGQPNLNGGTPPGGSGATPPAAANQLLNPVSVSVSPDGTHLFVADLGFNRVLIWNTLPTQNGQPADVVIGQRNMTDSSSNSPPALCGPTGTDQNGGPLFPPRCEKTLNFPRYALSDGTRLYVADGGNDRVLVFNTIPTANATAADAVLGQPDFLSDVVTNQTASILSTTVDNSGSVSTLPSPQALAWDGANLYVSDPNNRRVMVFTPGDTKLGTDAILNAASRTIRQEGFVILAGTTPAANDTATVTIAGTAYSYTVQANDTVQQITQQLVTKINTGNGDPNVFATLSTTPNTIALTSKGTNLGANSISLAATSSNQTNFTATASGSFLTAGNSATVAPGTLIEIDGNNLSDQVVSTTTNGGLPDELGGVQVYADGFTAPLMMVSPSQIIAQLPTNFNDRTSTSVFVRTVHNDGSITVTTASPLAITAANPGLFGAPNATDPRPAYAAMHQASNPNAVLSIDGSVTAGNIATVSVNGRAYSYTVQAADTLASIATALVNAINAATDPQVTAAVGGAFARVVLTARQPGVAGNGIPVAGSVNSGATVTVTAYAAATCCVTSQASQLITADNPASPGETITLLATGLGAPSDPAAQAANQTGAPYNGPQPNSPIQPVNATVNGSATAQVVGAGLAAGGVGTYQVQLLLPSDLPINPNTQVYIAQNAFISNIVTVPVGPVNGGITANPNPIPVGPGGTLGTTTLSWNVPQSLVQVRIDGPGGKLFSTGSGQGSAQTGNWVTEGQTYYLQDASTGDPTNPANTIGKVTVHLQQAYASLTATPIVVPAGTQLGSTTLSWNAPGVMSGVILRIGGPDGKVITTGAAQGAATASGYVTDGTTFTLQDLGNPAVILATLTVHFQQPTATLYANPNPAPPMPGTGLAGTTFYWNAPAATGGVQLYVGDPANGGVLVSQGTAQGSAFVSSGLVDGQVFYLQDLTGGNPTAASSTLATTIIHVQTTKASFAATPNPILVPAGTTTGQTILSWNAPGVSAIEIHLNSPNGTLMSLGGSSGTAFTGDWVSDGLVFYLQDAANGNATDPANTLATTTVRVQTQQ